MSKLLKLMRASAGSGTNRIAVGLGALIGIASQSEFIMDLLSQNPKYLGWFALAQTGLLLFQRIRKGHVNILDIVNKGLKAAANATPEIDEEPDEDE